MRKPVRLQPNFFFHLCAAIRNTNCNFNEKFPHTFGSASLWDGCLWTGESPVIFRKKFQICLSVAEASLMKSLYRDVAVCQGRWFIVVSGCFRHSLPIIALQILNFCFVLYVSAHFGLFTKSACVATAWGLEWKWKAPPDPSHPHDKIIIESYKLPFREILWRSFVPYLRKIQSKRF